MRHPRVIIAGIGVAVPATAGGITAATASTCPASGAPAASHSAAATTVRTAQVAVGGKMETILTTATGQPLYYYQPDTAARSLVTGSLARAVATADIRGADRHGTQWQPRGAQGRQWPAGHLQRPSAVHLR
jgi:predicted lipoprotein with Yx(FWY)xxD motif